MNKKKIYFLLIIIFTSFYKIGVFANDNTYINTENIFYDEKNKIIELAKNSKINVNDTNISIDKGVINLDTKTIEVYGDFYLSHFSNIISGKDLKGNSNLDKYSATGVSFLYNNKFKIDSKKINKDEQTIIFYDNFITSCKIDGYFNCPTWSFRVKKTDYDIKNDKFTHYDTFLQILDYKVLYLPYFSHYGKKAPRQRGFLTPSFMITIGENASLSTPYYIPIDETSDLIITPKIIFSENLNFDENFNITSIYEKKNSLGYINIGLENVKSSSESSLYSTWKVRSKQIINNKSVIKANALFTNSNSTSRSLNKEPIPFEDLSISLENYNNFIDNDYLKYEISSVESFDLENDNLIPTSISANYSNTVDYEFFFMKNNLNLSDTKRNISDDNNPYENINIGLETTLSNTNTYNKIINFNKITLYNQYNDYSFSHNPNLNRNENISNLSLSSEINYSINYDTTAILKTIYNKNILKNNDLVNEKSNALTFNYGSQYFDNRNFGYEESEDFFRIVYGLEKDYYIDDKNFSIKINQSYDFDKDLNYLSKINQTSKISDYAIEIRSKFDQINLKLDSRIDSKTLAKKEMNYTFSLGEEDEFEAIYNETDANSFQNLSNDSKSLKINLNKNISKNFSFSIVSNLDLKNNFTPYTNKLSLAFMDECSELEISYLNSRYNDNLNTKPEESININFKLDYIGLFEIEEKTNLINFRN